MMHNTAFFPFLNEYEGFFVAEMEKLWYNNPDF